MPRVRVGLGWWKDLQHPGQQHTSRRWRLRNHKRDQDVCADGQISDIAQDLCWSLNKDYPGSMHHLFIPYSDSTTCPQHAFILEYDWYLVAFWGGGGTKMSLRNHTGLCGCIKLCKQHKSAPFFLANQNTQCLSINLGEWVWLPEFWRKRMSLKLAKCLKSLAVMLQLLLCLAFSALVWEGGGVCRIHLNMISCVRKHIRSNNQKACVELWEWQVFELCGNL